MPDYGGSEKKNGGGGKGGGMEDRSDARLSSNKGWSPPQGMPEPPGESSKIPRPE